jgi:hypothetical protein
MIMTDNNKSQELQKVNVAIQYFEMDYFGVKPKETGVWHTVCQFKCDSVPHTEIQNKAQADRKLLNQIFEGFNWGSGMEMDAFINAEIRSLSVGDRVRIEFNGQTAIWECEEFNWARIDLK